MQTARSLLGAAGDPASELLTRSDAASASPEEIGRGLAILDEAFDVLAILVPTALQCADSALEAAASQERATPGSRVPPDPPAFAGS